MVVYSIQALHSFSFDIFCFPVAAQQQYYEDQLDSPMGPNPDACHNNACCHNAAYCNGNDHVDFFLDGHTPPYSLWKPPSFYFPHEDAPPPYSEVVGNSYRMTQTSTSYPALGPLMVQLGSPTGESSESNGGGALALIGAIGGGFRGSSCCSTQSPSRVTSTGKRLEVALRSDEVYEDVDVTTEDLPPPYFPSSQPFSSQDQEMVVTRDTISRQGHSNRNSETDGQVEESVFGAEDTTRTHTGPEQHPVASTSTTASNNRVEQLKHCIGAAPVR